MHQLTNLFARRKIPPSLSDILVAAGNTFKSVNTKAKYARNTATVVGCNFGGGSNGVSSGNRMSAAEFD